MDTGVKLAVNILGISAFYHDSAACLVQDGKIIAAAQEERFSRKKHDHRFPVHAVGYCLQEGKVAPGELDVVVFYDKPLTKFMRLANTYFRVAPMGFPSFQKAMSLWVKQKLWIPYEIEYELARCGHPMPKQLYFTEHHESHAASAFFPSPFESAAILCMDAVGEWATSTVSVGKGNKIELLRELRFPHSLGLLYSAFTAFTGFRVNSGEYKLMGLAPYGQPRYVDRILKHLVDLREDGSFHMNQRYFNYTGGLTMTNRMFAELFDGPPRRPETEITVRERDLARSIQVVTEEIVMRMARYAQLTTGERRAVLAGGVALNCVANGKLLRDGPFDEIWIQPAAGDAGGALGAAMYIWHQVQNNERVTNGRDDQMQGAYLGPRFEREEIHDYLKRNDYVFEHIPDPDAWARRIAQLIADQKVIGLCHGRMEFGPRALGHRSIIGDARSPKMQSIMNLKIKYRESFRPFAPSVLQERIGDYFELDVESPYMLLVADVQPKLRREPVGVKNDDSDLRTWVNEVRSEIPAITHVDYSARVQSVSRDRSPGYHAIISAFEKLTSCGVIINTSFNVRGEPIVCTPEDAYRCFMRTEMDYLVLDEFVLDKHQQPEFPDKDNWREDYVLD